MTILKITGGTVTYATQIEYVLNGQMNRTRDIPGHVQVNLNEHARYAIRQYPAAAVGFRYKHIVSFNCKTSTTPVIERFVKTTSKLYVIDGRIGRLDQTYSLGFISETIYRNLRDANVPNNGQIIVSRGRNALKYDPTRHEIVSSL